MATFVQTDSNNALSTGATVTWTSANIGTANANRQVLLFWSSGSFIATSVTIGGISATKIVEESAEIAGLQIWQAAVPTGTTANIVITAAGGGMTSVLAICGSLITAQPAVVNTGSNINNTDPNSITITVPASGVGVAVVGTNNGAASTITWSGVTLDVSIQESTPRTISSSHSTTTGSVTFQAQNLNGAAQNHMVAATWGDTVASVTPPTLGRVGV